MLSQSGPETPMRIAYCVVKIEESRLFATGECRRVQDLGAWTNDVSLQAKVARI